jgi:nucleotide-binding universal stress UspA family protein
MKTVYRHLLLPTDGSSLANRGTKAGLKLAQALGARVTLLHVSLPFMSQVYADGEYYAGPSPEEYKRLSEKAAEKTFAPLLLQAKRAGVDCAKALVTNARAWEGIVKTAGARKCDLIVMGSHGRGGLRGLFLGSETQRVLAQSKYPVLVIR